MQEGITDSQGYPIADLYYILRYQAASEGIDLYSTDTRNNRPLLKKIGVPECRIPSVTPYLIAAHKAYERVGLPSDYDNVHNLPEELT